MCNTGLPGVSALSPDLRQPSQRIFEARTKLDNFSLWTASVNAVQGKLEIFQPPINTANFSKLVDIAASKDGCST